MRKGDNEGEEREIDSKGHYLHTVLRVRRLAMRTERCMEKSEEILLYFSSKEDDSMMVTLTRR